MFKFRSKTLSALGSLFLATTIAVALLSNASAEESTGAKAAETTPAPPIASDDVAPKFFLGYRQLLEEANGQLPVEVGPEFVGISMVPIVSRSRALDEAKANALKSEYKTFVMTYDRMETMTTFVTGPHSVIKFRAIDWVEKTPDKVMTLIVNGNAKPIEHLVAAALVTTSNSATVGASAGMSSRIGPLGGAAGGAIIGGVVSAFMDRGKLVFNITEKSFYERSTRFMNIANVEKREPWPGWDQLKAMTWVRLSKDDKGLILLPCEVDCTAVPDATGVILPPLSK